MQSVSSRIWTRVTVSASNDDNHYTTGTSQRYLVQIMLTTCWVWVWVLFNGISTSVSHLRVRLVLSSMQVLEFNVWVSLKCFIIFDKILMKWLVSFRKLKIFFGLVFSKRSFKLLVWLYFGRIYLNLSQFMRMCLTMKDTLYVALIGGVSPCCVWVTGTKHVVILKVRMDPGVNGISISSQIIFPIFSAREL